VNSEAVDGAAIPRHGLGEQGLSAQVELDQIQHRIDSICFALVGEVHPRIQADVYSTRSDPEIDV
jgi:hypothetical protein